MMLMAKGYNVGQQAEKFLKDRALDVFLKPSQEYLREYPEHFVLPVDLAYENDGRREEIEIENLPRNVLFPDIGHKTIALFKEEIQHAGTLFFNGPPGMYENPLFEDGTRETLQTIAEANGYSVIGGGETVAAARQAGITDRLHHVSTGGGASLEFLAGKTLPGVAALEASS